MKTSTLIPSSTAVGFVYVWDLINPASPTLVAGPVSQPGAIEGSDAASTLGNYIVSTTASENFGGNPSVTRFEVALTGLFPLAFPGGPFSNTGSIADAALAWSGSQLDPLIAMTPHEGACDIRNLKTGSAVILGGSVPDRTSAPCQGMAPYGSQVTYGLRDAVALTSRRVVALANTNLPDRILPAQFTVPGGASYGCMVGLGNVDGATTGFPVTHFPMGCGANGGFMRAFVHDLAVAPDENWVAVSGQEFLATYDLGSGLQVGLRSGASFPCPNFSYNGLGNSMVTLDSVEVSNSHVVVIGNDHNWTRRPPPTPSTPGADTARCEIAVARIRGSGSILADRVWSSTQLFNADEWPGSLTRACDLCITPSGRWAIVHTRSAVVVLDLSTASLAAILPQLLPAPDPFWFSATSLDTQISDSLACTNSSLLVIGRRQVPVVGGPAVSAGFVDLFTISNSGLSLRVSFNLGADVLPTDVVISPSGSVAVVRSRNTAVVQASDPASGAIHYIDIAAGTLASPSLGGTGGWSRGLDHVECTDKWAVTVGDAGAAGGRVQFITY